MPLITINGWYKPSNMGAVLSLYPHYMTFFPSPQPFPSTHASARMMRRRALAMLTSVSLKVNFTNSLLACVTWIL